VSEASGYLALRTLTHATSTRARAYDVKQLLRFVLYEGLNCGITCLIAGGWPSLEKMLGWFALALVCIGTPAPIAAQAQPPTDIELKALGEAAGELEVCSGPRHCGRSLLGLPACRIGPWPRHSLIEASRPPGAAPGARCKSPACANGLAFERGNGPPRRHDLLRLLPHPARKPHAAEDPRHHAHPRPSRRHDRRSGRL
jgi:hypothetical protein